MLALILIYLVLVVSLALSWVGAFFAGAAAFFVYLIVSWRYMRLMLVADYFYVAALKLIILSVTLTGQLFIVAVEHISPSIAYDFSVFTERNLTDALVVNFTALFAIDLVWLVCSRTKTERDSTETRLSDGFLSPRLNYQSALLVSIVAVLLSIMVFATSDSVLDRPYPFNKSTLSYPYWFLNLITFMSFALPIVRLTRGDTLWGHLGARVIMLFPTTLTSLLVSGSRGTAFALTAILLALDYIFVLRKEGSRRKFLSIASVDIVFLVFLLAIWPVMRGDLAQLSLIDAFSRAIGVNFQLISNSLINIDLIPMFPQSLFHLLYVIDLVAAGKDVALSSFLNLPAQQIPEFVSHYFGGRPLNDAYRLMEFYRHGGGFYLPANAYWNGGNGINFAFFLVLTFVLVKYEEFFHEEDFQGRIGYWFSLPLFMVGVLYGIQPLVRSLEIALVIYFFGRIWRSSA